jgi:hypothetical protein
MLAERDHANQPCNRRRIVWVLLGFPFFCYLFLFFPAGTCTWLKG